MHRDHTSLPTDVQCQSCACGAAPEHPYGLCHKCHTRMTWRRRTAEIARRAARRRRRGRQARERARLVVLAACSVGTDRAGS